MMGRVIHNRPILRMFKPWHIVLFLFVVVLAVVGFIFWYYWTPGAGIAPTDTMQPVVTDTMGTGSTATTDAALDADLASIDAQLSAVADDAASVDASFNDQPVEQTE